MCFSPVSLSVCRGFAIDFEWIFSLSLPNGPPSFKSVSFPSLSLSLLFHTRYSARYKSSTQWKQRTHTHVYYTGGVICCGREPIGIRRTLSHFEPSDTRRDRFHAHFFASIYTNAQKVYIGCCCWPPPTSGERWAASRRSDTHIHSTSKERERERVGRAGKMLCTQGRNRERL